MKFLQYSSKMAGSIFRWPQVNPENSRRTLQDIWNGDIFVLVSKSSKNLDSGALCKVWSHSELFQIHHLNSRLLVHFLIFYCGWLYYWVVFWSEKEKEYRSAICLLFRWSKLATLAQCGNFRIFLSFRFYVKSIFENLEVLKLLVLPFLGLWILLIW